jgi:hypothetical protein
MSKFFSKFWNDARCAGVAYEDYLLEGPAVEMLPCVSESAVPESELAWEEICSEPLLGVELLRFRSARPKRL